MKKAFKLAIAGALFSMGAVASAAVVTQTSTPIIDITHIKTPTALAFSTFDASLGTLTSAQFTFYSTISGTARVENMGDDTLTTTVGSGAALTVAVTGLSPVTVNTVYTQTVTLGAFDQTQDFGGTSGTMLPFTAKSVTSSTALLNSTAALSAFTNATGNVSAGFSGVFLGSGSGNVVFSGNSKVTTYAVLTYNYTPTAVPEPETYGMLLTGLGLMGVVARKRKAKKSA